MVGLGFVSRNASRNIRGRAQGKVQLLPLIIVVGTRHTEGLQLVGLLERLQVSVDDLLGVEVEHAAGHLPAPPDHLRRQDLRLPLDVIVEGPPGAELHDNTVAGGLGTHTPVSVDVCVEGGGEGGGGGGKWGKTNYEKDLFTTNTWL